MALLAMIILVGFRSKLNANLVANVAHAMAFIPTLRGLWHGRKKEKALFWFVWAGAFFFGDVVVVILRWQGNPVDLISPITIVLLHIAVGLLALRSPRRLA